MQVDDPPYLSVGTAVSAKYKGAFCEAKVSKVDRVVKCKITYRMGLGSATVTDNDIKGTLRIGQQVQVKHPDRKDYVDATITKIQDCSQYTVVFDDGDITSLRRTALCLKSGRHFNESETLDQLPLTHPEHFSNPVVGGRRGRRSRQLKDDSSDEEMDEENEPDLEGYAQDIGRVVSVETGESKRGKEKWFPGLIVIPSAQPTVKINIKDEFLIRSFRDDRYYTVPKKEVSEFTREQAEKVDSSGLMEAIQKAIKFLDSNELPLHWEKSSLFNISDDSDSYDIATDSSDDEQSEEKDRFVAQLYKFMDDSGTPLNKTPVISNKDMDLHRLFIIVQKLGGYNRVSNQNKWKLVASKLKLPLNQATSSQVKSAYKKCLLTYESFHRTLGVTMSNPTRTKKNKGRSLIRDKDRTPISSPRPDRDDEPLDPKLINKKTELLPFEKLEVKQKRKNEMKEDSSGSRKVKSGDVSDGSSDISEQSTSSGRPKRLTADIVKPVKEKTLKTDEKTKSGLDKFEENVKKDEKVQQTRSKTVTNLKLKETSKETASTSRPSKDVVSSVKSTSKLIKKVVNKDEEDKEKKPKHKRKSGLENDKPQTNAGTIETTSSYLTANLGDKLSVYYGPTNESKVTYEAKVVNIQTNQSGPVYLVHYTGWNTRYDEWIPPSRIAENLSTTFKSKRGKISATNMKLSSNVGSSPSSSSSSTTPSSVKSAVIKKSRNTPTTSNKISSSTATTSTTNEEKFRSLTPSVFGFSSSSGSSSSSKGATTPATRAGRLAARQESSKNRRSSAQTDISLHSDSESEISGSETEISRTRSGSTKPEDTEIKVYKKKLSKTVASPSTSPIKIEKRKYLDDIKKDDEKKVKNAKKSLEKSPDECDGGSATTIITTTTTTTTTPATAVAASSTTTTQAKGRDFDLNQIRSELKGFSKTIKLPQSMGFEKDTTSIEESISNVLKEIKEEIKVEEQAIKTVVAQCHTPKHMEKSPQSSSSSPPPPPTPLSLPIQASEDIYEFKEPEPFEFEGITKLVDDKTTKKRMTRIYEELEKTTKKKSPLPLISSSSSSSFVEKCEKFDLSEPKTYSRVSKTLAVSSDDDTEDSCVNDDEAHLKVEEEKKEDPFDKLIESPTYNIVKTIQEKIVDKKPLSNMSLEEPLHLFKELADSSEESNKEIELVDSENSQTNNKIFRDTSETLFSDAFTKSSPEASMLDLEFSNSKMDEGKTTNSDDSDIQAQIQRVIAQSSSTDDDSNDVSLNPSTSSRSKFNIAATVKVETEETEKPLSILGSVQSNKESSIPLLPVEEKIEIKNVEPEPEEVKQPSPKKPIDPALQETDSSLLESIVAKPPLILDPKLNETCKDLSLKTGTKIADSLLLKFNSIKNSSKFDISTSTTEKFEIKSTTTSIGGGGGGLTFKSIDRSGPEPSTSSGLKNKLNFDLKPNLPLEFKLDTNEKSHHHQHPQQQTKLKATDFKTSHQHQTTKSVCKTDMESKRRKRVISKPYIEDTDSDSTDSEHLVIVKSDDDSRTNFPDNNKLRLIDYKENTVSFSKLSTIDHQGRIVKDDKSAEQIDICQDTDELDIVNTHPTINTTVPTTGTSTISSEEQEFGNSEKMKEEENPNLHTLLFCEEEIPRSPAPAPELSNSIETVRDSSVHEMPFASAPGTSNCKILIGQNAIPPPSVRDERPPPIDVRVVNENTLTTAAERTISNLSPRIDNSLNVTISSSSKSKSPEITNVQVQETETVNTIKLLQSNEESVSQISNEITTLTKKPSGGGELCAPPIISRKRRTSYRSCEEVPHVPGKRGRKPANKRRDSDSDDASENSIGGNGNISGGNSTHDRSARSPRPSRYNFFVEFDPSLDSSQRIAVLQQKLCDLKKTYVEVKAELVAVERRRKKLRRREREALKTAKQELTCI